MVNTNQSVKLPDGVSYVSVNLGELTIRGPTGTTITVTAGKPDFNKEENTKVISYGETRSGYEKKRERKRGEEEKLMNCRDCKKLAYKKHLGKTIWNKRTFKVEERYVHWNKKHPKRMYSCLSHSLSFSLLYRHLSLLLLL